MPLGAQHVPRASCILYGSRIALPLPLVPGLSGCRRMQGVPVEVSLTLSSKLQDDSSCPSPQPACSVLSGARGMWCAVHCQCSRASWRRLHALAAVALRVYPPCAQVTGCLRARCSCRAKATLCCGRAPRSLMGPARSSRCAHHALLHSRCTRSLPRGVSHARAAAGWAQCKRVAGPAPVRA